MSAAIAGTISTIISSEAAMSDLGATQFYKGVPEELTVRQRPHGSSERLLSKKTFSISIETVVMSALIFIGVLAWFEFLRAWYDHTFDNQEIHNVNIIINRFWYAVFISSICVIIIYIIYVTLSSN